MTESIARKHLTSGDKVFLAFAFVFIVVNLIDFAFYGQHLRNAVAAIGLSLMAYGTYRKSKIFMIIGAVGALGAIAAKYLL